MTVAEVRPCHSCGHPLLSREVVVCGVCTDTDLASLRDDRINADAQWQNTFGYSREHEA